MALSQIDIKVLLPLVGGLVAIAIFLINLWRSKAEMSFEVVSSTPVVPAQSRLPDQLKVTFNGVEVREASVVVLRLINTGRVDIKRDSFDALRPIRFDFDKTKVLDASIVDAKARTMREIAQENLEWTPEKANTSSQVKLKPFLWHSRDWLRLSFLLAGPISPDDISVEAWTEGFNKVKRIRTSDDRSSARVILRNVLFESLINGFYYVLGAATPFLLSRVLGTPLY